MVRTLIVTIVGDSWNITDIRVKEKDYRVSSLDLDGWFASVYEANGKLVHVFNYTLPDECIIEAKNAGGMFLEQCLFTHEKHTFSGDFLDAFLYIQNVLQKNKKKELKEANNGR